MKLTKEQLAHLSGWKPETYAREIPHAVARPLEAAGLLSWVPPMFGSSHLYAITDEGRRALAQKVKP